MNKKSHYLDNLINEWEADSKREYENNNDYIVSNIEGFKKGWNLKKRKDKVVLPLLSLFFFLNIFLNPTLGAMLVASLPFLSFTLITYLQISSNNKVDAIDLSLGVSDYRDKRFKIYSGELKHLKRFRFLMYPTLFIHHLYKFLYVYNYNAIKTMTLFIVTIIGLTFIVLMLEYGISELQDKIRDLE